MNMFLIKFLFSSLKILYIYKVIYVFCFVFNGCYGFGGVFCFVNVGIVHEKFFLNNVFFHKHSNSCCRWKLL